MSRRISLQQQKLEQATERFTMRDKAIFARITDAMTKHDTARQNVFTNELHEVRKMLECILKTKFALEQANKLLKIDDIGTFPVVNQKELSWAEFLVNLCTVSGTLNVVRFELVAIFPEAENELGEISSHVSGIMASIAEEKEMMLDFKQVATAVKENLETAAMAAKKQMADKFPNLP